MQTVTIHLFFLRVTISIDKYDFLNYHYLLARNIIITRQKYLTALYTVKHFCRVIISQLIIIFHISISNKCECVIGNQTNNQTHIRLTVPES